MAANPMNIMDVANYVQQQGALGQQQGQTQRFNALAGQAYNAPAGADRSALVGQAVATSPTMGVQLGNVLASKDAAAQTADTNHLQKIANAAKLMVQVYNGGKGDPAAIQGTWNNIAPYLGQVSGKAPPPQFDPSMLPAMYQAIAASNQGPEKGIVLGGGSQLRSPTGELLADNPTVPNMQFQNVSTGKLDASGNPIMQQGGYNPRTGAFMPVQGPAPAAGNAQPQGMHPGATTAQLPAGAGSTYAPSLPAVLSDAVLRQESGGNPAAVSSAGATGLMQLMPQTAANPGFGIMPAKDGSQQENQRVGQQYLAALSQKYGGNMQLALAAYNAGPGRVDAAMQQAGGDPTKAISSLPDETQNYIPSVLAMAGGQPGAQAAPTAQLGFGQSVKAPAAAAGNTITKRVEDLKQMASQGIPINNDQRNTYLTTGKFAADANAPLSPGEENEAKQLSVYGLPVSPYMLSKPAMQPIIARALELNGNFRAGQYAVNQKVMMDLASNSPTSSGGVVTAANASIGHLDDMADISKNLANTKFAGSLPFGNAIDKGINAVSNAAVPASSKQADAIKSWNAAKSFLAGETAKMVKGGVASESEVRDLMDSLNPNDPNRDVALATFAKFMNDKAEALEQKRDDVLGSASPHTSLLSKVSQNRATRLIGLNPDYTLPQFQNAGSLSNPNQGQPGQTPGVSTPPTSQQTAQTSQPRAVNPQTGHAVVWNGSAWVPE